MKEHYLTLHSSDGYESIGVRGITQVWYRCSCGWGGTPTPSIKSADAQAITHIGSRMSEFPEGPPRTGAIVALAVLLCASPLLVLLSWWIWSMS